MSTNIPPNLAKMVLKQTGKSAIEELELWELREAVSYVVDLPLFLTKKRLEQAKRQTTRIVNNTPCSLSSDILVQALIQQLLRIRGIEIKCWNLNQFPKSSKQLAVLLERSRSKQIQFWYHQLRNKLKTYQFVLILAAVIVYNIVAFNPTLLFSGILFAYVMHFVLQVVEHDYFNHRYIVPKNPTIARCLEILCLFSLGNIEFIRASHMNHHTKWNTKDDQIHILASSNKWGHLFATESRSLTVRQTSDLNALAEKTNNKLARKSVLHQFASKNQSLLLMFLSIATLLVFGLAVMINFMFMSILWHRVFGAMPDVAFYIADKQKNFPWLYPIMLRDSYHKFHHEKFESSNYQSIEDLFPGPKWLKYLNFEYYLMKGFFKFNN